MYLGDVSELDSLSLPLLAVPIIALLVVFAGFLILPSKMGWLQFVYLCNPYAYAIKSLAQNEFSADRYNNILPTGQTLGESYLSYFDMPTDLAYKWGGVGFLLGVTAILLVCNITIFYLGVCDSCAWGMGAPQHFSSVLVTISVRAVRFDNNIGSARHLADDESDKSLRPPVLSTAHVTLELPLSVHAAPLAFHDDDETHHHELPVVGSHVAVAAASTALPFAPASVAFRNVTYTVKLRGGAEKTLLHRVSGFALPGRMLALMGASGAGGYEVALFVAHSQSLRPFGCRQDDSARRSGGSQKQRQDDGRCVPPRPTQGPLDLQPTGSLLRAAGASMAMSLDGALHP